VAGVGLGDIHDIHPPVAWQAWHGVGLGDIHILFASQAWHLWHWKLGLRQVRGLVTKLHARFHFQCVGFETAVTCFLSFSIHQLCGAGCSLICNMVLFNLDAAVVALTQRGKNTCIA